LFVFLSTFVLAQCATGQDDRFRVGEAAGGLAMIGVAETADEREPAFTMLWRRLDEAGAFSDYSGRSIFEARTNSNDSVRVRGIPGEFAVAQLEPGVYALDSVFAVVRDGRLNYIAQGVIEGQRPAFEVRPGEAVYLGIWELDLDGANAVARPWRLDGADLRVVTRAANATIGDVRLRETHSRNVSCQPHRLNNISQRQVC
jgi:hypothetical protein